MKRNATSKVKNVFDCFSCAVQCCTGFVVVVIIVEQLVVLLILFVEQLVVLLSLIVEQLVVVVFQQLVFVWRVQQRASDLLYAGRHARGRPRAHAP